MATTVPKERRKRMMMMMTKIRDEAGGQLAAGKRESDCCGI